MYSFLFQVDNTRIYKLLGGIYLKKLSICLATICLLFTTITTVEATQRSLTTSIINTKGQVIGTATFTEDDKGVNIHVQAAQLPPGAHGIHIHEKGECTPPDFKTAGEHFNPIKHKHGFNNPEGYHNGDLPNIVVDEQGNVDVILNTKDVTLKKRKDNSLLKKNGTTLIIHASEDDYVTDPSGNSGARIACGVISK